MILGIETTAHTFGIGIADKGRILANVRDTYTTEKGGIIPIEAARHHRQVAERLYKGALAKAGISEKEIKAIALANAPGLAPCLIAGMNFAKELATRLEVKIIPVNHCLAHLEIARITGAKDPVLLYASGANTQIIAYAGGKYRVFGETLDIGIGNCIDTFARYAGFGFPGGPKIAKLAEEIEKLSDKEEHYIELPYTIKGMDIAFSGILTNLRQKLESKKYKIGDLAFSLQETIFPMLVEASERAMAHTGKIELALGGGVACNKRLQEMCAIMCAERGAKFFCPANEFLVDNGAMIAYTGEIILNADKNVGIKCSDIDIKPRQRTDEVEVGWR